MRDRRPEDWRVDLRDRHGLENLVAGAIDHHRGLTRLSSSTSSMTRLDYQLLLPGDRLGELELKAKRQTYRNWPGLGPGVLDRDVFILDELALRRIVDAGRYAFLLVRDIPSDRWCLWGTAELVLTTKIRVSRGLTRVAPTVKGKLLIDLGSAPVSCPTVEASLDELCRMARAIDERWDDIRPWPWIERTSSSGSIKARGA
ncbi:MAG TPA: hypothetical protein VGR90_02715 [Acidimicrobiales bacterium]|nr:hypothetical protein [Acidimicrobiales bacterium]